VGYLFIFISEKRILHYWFLAIGLFWLSCEPVIAQDPSFSQFYANPLYLNPALAGTGECSRVMVNFRQQWPSYASGFKTYAVSADSYIRSLSGGLGLMAYADDAAGLVNSLNVSGIYAYHLRMSSSVSLNAGIEASWFQQRLNWDQFVFSDMINYNDGTINQGGSAESPPDNLTVSTVDFSGGLLLGISQKYYFGFAAHHLHQPVLEHYLNGSNPLYLKFTLHGGVLFTIREGNRRDQKGKLILSPNVLYQQQHEARQVNVGLNVEYFPLVTGMWYRHNMDKPDGIIFLVGIVHKSYKFAYSYDVTLSKLKGSTGGAHELSMALLFNCDVKRKRPGAIKCPEF
jgi:type IX secretion system PorP/SprF family membrane protein